jgi:glutamine amidotransferase
MGLSFNVPVRSEISFRGFMKRGRSNPDGWGLALFPDGKAAQVLKEPVEAGKSRLAELLRDYPHLKSTVFVGHVRYASKGDPTYSNTYPFEGILHAKDYVFAHNGTLQGFKGKRSNEFIPLGDTDSEWAFCQVIDWLNTERMSSWSAAAYANLEGVFRNLNKYGGLNILMSDGDHLFCYHDKDRRNGLCYVQREFAHTRIRLLDEDWVDDLGKTKDLEQKGYVVATRPLTDEKWTDFSGGQLIVFCKGEVVHE